VDWLSNFLGISNRRISITAIDHTLSALIALTKDLSVGTNLGLLHILWMLVSGTLLAQRGAIFPALKAIGLSDGAARRAWSAFRHGSWRTPDLLHVWGEHIEALNEWEAHTFEGYRVKSVDVTGFWRPSLESCLSKHYHPAARRALPAVIMGIVGEVGEINGQRIAIPRVIERVHPQNGSEKELWRILLRKTRLDLEDDEIVAVDAGVKIVQLQEAEIEHYVVRLATNFTARRNELPTYTGKGRRPVYGERVRPLPRKFKDKTIDATPPDRIETWEYEGRTIVAHVWENLVLPKLKPGQKNKTFNVYALFDPKFKTPWLLATPLKFKAITVKAIYTDRWSVEQLPLAAKHMVGAHRQFVHADESIQRLPELALLAGSILSFLAATMPLQPTGFWDKSPKRTPGRFRRLLQGKPFPQSSPLPEQFRKKESFTAHLPKGILAVRSKIARPRQQTSVPTNLPPATVI
jgi:hypothetical protein